MSSPSSSPRSRGAWVGVAAGWGLIAIGVRGVLHDADATEPTDLLRWVGGLLLLHDLLLVPIVVAAGYLVGRLAPRVTVIPLQLALSTSAIVIALGWPLVRGYGERSANPSLLPLAYRRNVVVLLAIIWTVTAATVVVRLLLSVRRRRRPVERHGESAP
jgi:hypothetical protein